MCDASNRLGDDVQELMSHSFFNNTDWDHIRDRPAAIPVHVKHMADTSNFDDFEELDEQKRCEGAREGGRERGREQRKREGEREGEREGGRKGGREKGRVGRREREGEQRRREGERREKGREGGRKRERSRCILNIF